MNDLTSIRNFGAIDAENDERLFDYFIESLSLKRILEYTKSIVIGRKGSGKTAIYKYLEKLDSDKFVAPLLFKDYPWKIHDNFQNAIVTDAESFVNSWTFLILIELAKLIVKSIDNYDTKNRRDVKKLRKWLIKNWGTSDFSHKQTMSPIQKKWQGAFNPSIFGNSLGSIMKQDSQKTQLGDTLSEINKKLESIVFKLLIKDKNYYLLFDELDLGYSPDDPKYLVRIIGLLLAVYNIIPRIKNSKVNCFVYVFLRSDIYNILEFQDKNKITDNLVEYLKWEAQDEIANLSLKQLVSKRIGENINSSTFNFQENWDKVFDRAKIGKNQLKWNFITERTFLRPRDLIKFLNLSLDEAKRRIIGDDDIRLIINMDIQNIRKVYSDYLYSELKDEVCAKYKDFDNYLEILRNIHYSDFTIDSFEESYGSISKRLSIRENSSTVLERLYEFSIIGFYKPGGGGLGGSTYCYQYIDPNIKFNPKAIKYRIHPGFKEYLELIEPR